MRADAETSGARTSKSTAPKRKTFAFACGDQNAQIPSSAWSDNPTHAAKLLNSTPLRQINRSRHHSKRNERLFRVAYVKHAPSIALHPHRFMHRAKNGRTRSTGAV